MRDIQYLADGHHVDDAGNLIACAYVDVRVRTLLVHQAEGFRERGLAVSLSDNPTPSTTAPGSMRTSATGCRSAAASSGRPRSASQPPPTGGTTGWATASARSAVRGRRSSSVSMRSGGNAPRWAARITARARRPRWAGNGGAIARPGNRQP